MAPETRSLLAAVLALPEAERIFLMDGLLDALSPVPDEPTDEELDAELDRRFEEYRRDSSVAVPWSEIRRPR